MNEIRRRARRRYCDKWIKGTAEETDIKGMSSRDLTNKI